MPTFQELATKEYEAQLGSPMPRHDGYGASMKTRAEIADNARALKPHYDAVGRITSRLKEEELAKNKHGQDAMTMFYNMMSQPLDQGSSRHGMEIHKLKLCVHENISNIILLRKEMEEVIAENKEIRADQGVLARALNRTNADLDSTTEKLDFTRKELDCVRGELDSTMAELDGMRKKNIDEFLTKDPLNLLG
tara:strand:- start:1499 stop:2077 length:579 start_codon:yes stop_codon:yes gene_type:complete